MPSMRWHCGRVSKSFPDTRTCSRPCRAALRCGPRGLPPNCAMTPKGCSSRSGASVKTRWAAAGFGTPNLDISRESTRRRLGFAVTQEPVTAVQLSRGKAEAQLLFEITLLTQDLGRLAADLMLFYSQEFAYVSLQRNFEQQL